MSESVVDWEKTPLHKVVIVGSGPAAHTAAIYTARATLEPVMFEGLMAGGVAAGGQLTTTTDVENYPGFPDGITGPAMMDLFRAQSIKCGAKIHTITVKSIDMSQRPFRITTESFLDPSLTHVRAETLIIATGATAKRLPILGTGEESEGGYWQRGVSACAVCDGALPIFRDKPLIVMGGGDSAAEEAMFLAHYASVVYLVHRRDEMRASKIMQSRVLNHPKVKPLLSHVVSSVKGDGKLMRSATVIDLKTGAERDIEAAGLFFAVGHVPNTAFLDNQLLLDNAGYITTTPGRTLTSVQGVFAAGDVQDFRYRQAITAAGSGCMAALDCERFLAEN